MIIKIDFYSTGNVIKIVKLNMELIKRINGTFQTDYKYGKSDNFIMFMFIFGLQVINRN